MKTNILNYINKLQAYKTAIKNLHWSSKHMNEHKLLDDIADSVANNQDEIAEMCQGLYGKIKLNELKPKRYKITNSKKMLFDLLRDTKSFNSSIKGRELTGVRSVVEAFIGEINKFVYLMDMCIKEDIKRNFKSSLNEAKTYISENELRKTISKAITKSLNENVDNNNPIQNFEQEIYQIMEQNEQKVMQQLKGLRQLTMETINNIKQLIQGIDNILEIGNVDFGNYNGEYEIIMTLPSIKEMDEEQIDNLNEKLQDVYKQINWNKCVNVNVGVYPKQITQYGTYCISIEISNVLPLNLKVFYEGKYNNEMNDYFDKL